MDQNDPYDCRSYSSPDVKHLTEERLREREQQVVARLIAIFVLGIAVASLLMLILEHA